MISKGPVGLTIFRAFLLFGVFVCMALLYWSSTLLEYDLKEVYGAQQALHNELRDNRIEAERFRATILNAIKKEQRQYRELIGALSNGGNIGAFDIDISCDNSDGGEDREHIDPSISNMLQEDIFYKETLPEMLGDDFCPQGKRCVALVGKPDNLHPFNNFASVSSLVSMCSVTLSSMHFGKYETMAPNAAVKIEERVNHVSGVPEFWVHLRDDIYWEPLEQWHFPDDVVLDDHFLQRHRVTSYDFQFFFHVLMNPHFTMGKAAALRTYYRDLESIDIIDDLTFVVRWKAEDVVEDDGSIVKKIKYIARDLTGGLRPLARFVYQYFADGTKIVEDDSDPDTYRAHSAWAQNFTQHWAKNYLVSCGPWLFDGMTEDGICLKRNYRHYAPYAALCGGVEFIFKESPDAVWQSFKLGEIDTCELRSDQLIELEEFLHSDDYRRQDNKVRQLRYVGRSYNYVGWNQKTPYFRSKRVRQALTYAIDRRRIIEQNLNDMGIEITGPFFCNSPSYDTTISPLPFDTQQARRLLEQEGWYDSDAEGTKDKEIGGKRLPFSFQLTYYVKNPTTKANVEYITTALKEIGVRCLPHGVDIADLSAAFDEKSFDAIYLGWSLGSPPEDPRQLWHSSGSTEKGSSNAVSFAHPAADKIIDALQYEYDQEKRGELYHRFHQIIHQEAPYVFLYTPKNLLVYGDYVQNVFIPKERHDLVPGATVAEPDSSIFWLKKS